MAGGIAGGAADARQARYVLAEGVSGDKSIRVIPTSHVGARRGQAGMLAIDLQETIVIEAQVMSMDVIVLFLERASCQEHIPIVKLAYPGRGARGCPGVPREASQGPDGYGPGGGSQKNTA